MEGTLEGLSDAQALDCIGTIVDRAADTHDECLTDQALRLSEELASRATLEGEHQVLLHYFRANAYEAKLHLAGEAQSWGWEISHLEKVLLELRRAIRHEAFGSLDRVRQCQMLTNTGNTLSSVGRPIEALVYWDRAISLNPRFAMALGNRGHGLSYYAGSIYDSGHAALLLASAHESFVTASSKDALYDSPQTFAHSEQFATLAAEIAERVPVDRARQDLLRNFSLGRSAAERSFRAWSLDNRLFLNPLNDLGAHSIAAHDVIHLPSMTTGLGEGGPGPPAVFGFYNQLKQEFVSARWLCFEGITEHRAHFSDRGTHLYDTLSIPVYSLAVEKTKLSMRMAYSLLDKIAFFINDYFNVGLPEKAVSFRGVWHERKGNPRPLAAVFKDRQNWPLRGLYWLSKDIYEPAFQEVAEPEAVGLAELRNHLEHKYCQVHEDLGIAYSRFVKFGGDAELGLHIGRDLIEAKTLHLLKRVRAALIYLSLAVHREERARNANRDASIVVQSPLWLWEERGRL
jgi:tetratricopeptide (TPR) repeat protein